ncbi:MAG: TonB-dependent receptor, partial [Vicinamibacteria bacterium]
MRKQVFIFSSLLVLLTLPPILLAQSEFTTGDIAGTVKDESGAVMPGVTVTLSGERIAGSQTFVTGPRGSYRFTGLPPGAYDLTYQLDGFATLNRQQITVSVGGTVELNVTLQLGSVAESVTVSGEQPVVDRRSTRINTSYDREWVENAPTRRFVFFDYLNSAPGISPASSTSSTSNVMGSGGDENTYQLDGTDITAHAFGVSWPWPDIDAIQEVEVIALGAPAEYAHASGAVFNIVTRQGSNEFRGDVNMYIQTDGLTGRNTSEEEDGDLPYRRDEFTDFTAQLGGPIARDKLWFFSGFQRQIDSFSQPGADPDFPAPEEKISFIGKLNYQINTHHKVNAMYHFDDFELPGTPTANDAPGSVASEFGKTQAVNLGYNGLASQSTVLEGHFSGFWSDDHLGPIDREQFPRIQPRFYDFDTGQVTGGTYTWYDGDIFKTAVDGKVTHYAEDFLGGSHDFKFGLQWTTGGANGIYGLNDLVYTYKYNGYRYAYGYKYGYYAYSGVANNLGVWADDSWQVNDRVTLNLGVRFDRKRAWVDDLVVKDEQGNPTGEEYPGIDNLFTWTPVSPRIGVNFQLTEDATTVLKAHYGRFYRAIITCEYCVSIGSSPRTIYFGDYDLETGTFSSLEVDAVLPGANSVDPSYTNPY